MARHFTLLLTRPAAQSAAFGEACRAAGFAGDVVVSPVIAIERQPIGTAPDPGTMLLFTSVNGVEQAAAQADLRGFSALAVGDATAVAARAAGIDCRSAAGTVDDLFTLAMATADAPLLHLRGRHGTGDLAARLRAAGRRADERAVYDQVGQPLDERARALLAGRAPVILPLFSPRSARLVAMQTREATAPLFPVAISPATARNFGTPPPPCIAERPDAAEMMRLIVAIARNSPDFFWPCWHGTE